MFIFVIEFNALIASNKEIVEASVISQSSKSRSLSFVCNLIMSENETVVVGNECFVCFVLDEMSAKLFETNGSVYLASDQVDLHH